MNQHQQARNLYFQTEMKQADIASMVGISDRTLGRWIAQDNWKQMKEAAKQAPIAIVEMLYKQLHALNSSICSRELPIPTMEEAEINRKLILSIDKLKRQASLSENIQVLMGFTGFLNKIDNELGKQVVTYADQYLKEKKGHPPFGFYEEPEDEDKYPDEELEYDGDDIQPENSSVAEAVIEKKAKPTAAIRKPASHTHTQETPVAQIETPPALKAEPSPFPTGFPEKDTAGSSPMTIQEEQQLQLQQKATNAFPAGSPERDPAGPSPITLQEEEQLLLQQKVTNAFYDEARRFADSQYKNKHRW